MRPIASVVLAALCLAAPTAAEAATSAKAASAPARLPGVVVYPAPAGVTPHEDYRVRVNGKEIFVWKSPIAAVAAFDLVRGEAEISVWTKYDAKWVDIRPLRHGLKAAIAKDGTFSFKVGKPVHLSVEIDRDMGRIPPLFVFVNPPETQVPSPRDKRVRFFEAGKVHTPGTMELRSGETIYIAGGAVVQGNIVSKGAKDIRILGRGILDGSPFHENRPKNRFVDLRECQRALVEGIILNHSPTWQIVPTLCDGVTIRNVKIVSDNGGDDGIDVVSSRNVLIEGSFVRTKDDCVAVKAFVPGHPPDASVKNVRVRNFTCWNALWGNALEIGFELRSGPVTDLVFEDIDIIHVERGAALSIHNGEGATVENVRFENIRIEDARHKLLDIAIFLSRYSRDATPELKESRLLGVWDGALPLDAAAKAKHAQYRGHVKNVLFKDIQVVDGPLPFSVFHGYDAEHRVDGVRIQNLTVRGQKIKTPEEGRFWISDAQVEFVD